MKTLVFWSFLGLAWLPNMAHAQSNLLSLSSETEQILVNGAMGELKWGMRPPQLLQILERRVRQSYAMRQDLAMEKAASERLKEAMQAQLVALRAGFDSSGTLLRHRHDVYVDYYHFKAGRLWKWQRVYDEANTHLINAERSIYEMGSTESANEERLVSIGVLGDALACQPELVWRNGNTTLRAQYAEVDQRLLAYTLQRSISESLPAAVGLGPGCAELKDPWVNSSMVDRLASQAFHAIADNDPYYGLESSVQAK